MIFDLLAADKAVEAREVAKVLLANDPDDAVVLVGLSQAERVLGNGKEAVQAGKDAWRSADGQIERYGAALAVAQALSVDGSKLRSQLWLRRAFELAPSEQARAAVAKDFRHVSGTSPWKVDLRFNIAPSSNVNNGAKSRRFQAGPISGTLSGNTLALSGIEYSAGATLTYRLKSSDRQLWRFSLDVDTRQYSLSSSAKRIAPNQRASDLSFGQLSARVETAIFGERQGFSTTFGAELGQNWYGGAPLTQFYKLSARRDMLVNERTALQFGLEYERQNRLDTDVRSADIVTISGGVRRRLNNGNNLTVFGFARDTSSASSAIDHQSAGVNVTYSIAKPIFGKTQLQLGLGASLRDYDQPAFGVLREDQELTARATLIFNGVNYFGFSPTATLDARRTKSNISLYETEELGISVGLRSSF